MGEGPSIWHRPKTGGGGWHTGDVLLGIVAGEERVEGPRACGLLWVRWRGSASMNSDFFPFIFIQIFKQIRICIGSKHSCLC
jgi:hypothetical protein